MLAEREAMIGPARVPLGVIDAMRNVSRVVLGEIDPSHGTCVPSGPRGELPACPRTLVGQDGVPWGSLPAPQQAFPSMLVRFSMAMWEIRPSQK
ncbi:hypothetical protein Lal_00046783 [Lupinus albus]|nr:hypothetical protein Lal_00046828 [Lupinus albus]KAF1856488.1 hypothetical protein Lal_00046783 [Lupinus albus]